jgi:hypothetical protein
MRIAYTIAGVGSLAMAAALAYGFLHGGGFAEVRELMRSPWFVVSLIDVYIGLALFAVWIAYRESITNAAGWILALMLLGNLVACAYVLIALARSRGNVETLMLGTRRIG